MFVEKMFAVPMAAGYEGFPFIATQAEKEMAEAFAGKARAERQPYALKAKAEGARFVVKAGCGSKRKAEEDREEEAAFTFKAKSEEEAAFTFKAKSEEEAAFTFKAKSEEEAVFTVKAKAEEEEEEDDDDCDSDEEEEFMVRLIADYNAHADKLRADHPGMKYKDYSTEEYAYMRLQPEEVEDDDCNKIEKLRAEYAYLFCKLEEEGSHGVDGLVRA
ncbi:unnamed protein product [Triticum turgidum subsp. durum]|uniref:Uncharacterized protein n=1 Tax=Triticum turgidum subsp. durum TaxID=4567 RepID=A0A9R1Q1K6_TRITD|nr:unnamed protein product [Triticum turgidum subsp. durum]